MDEFLRLAYERRSRLRRELASVETMIAEYERLDAGGDQTQSANFELPLKSPDGQNRSSRQRIIYEPILEAAREIILDEGKPLSRGEIVRRLEGKGFDLPGADRVKVFGTNLWRSKRFISLKGVGYWPEDRPLPIAYQGIEQRSSMLR